MFNYSSYTGIRMCNRISITHTPGVSPSQPVEHCDIGIHVEDVVGVRWVIGGRPLLRGGHRIGEVGRLRFALIINTIKCYHLEIVVYSVSEGVLLCLVGPNYHT